MTGLCEADVQRALRDCYDPKLPCNILDLGVVREIIVKLDEEAPGHGIAGVPNHFHVAVTLTPTTSDEDAAVHLRAQVSNRLAGIEAISSSEVVIAVEPSWNPGRITPAGRRVLGLAGNRSLVQIT